MKVVDQAVEGRKRLNSTSACDCREMLYTDGLTRRLMPNAMDVVPGRYTHRFFCILVRLQSNCAWSPKLLRLPQQPMHIKLPDGESPQLTNYTVRCEI
jgi:hypothetical protein